MPTKAIDTIDKVIYLISRDCDVEIFRYPMAGMEVLMGDVDWSHLSEIMKALGHPIRLRIVALLCEKDENVGALAGAMQAKPAIVSQQLSILRMRGLVTKSRVDGHAVYSLAEPRLRDLVSCVQQCRQPVMTAAEQTATSEGRP